MGIDLKNLEGFILQLCKGGAITTANDVDAAMVPTACYLRNFQFDIIASTTYSETLTLDINVNGTSIFGTKPTINGEGTKTYGVLTASENALAAGDVVSLDIDSGVSNAKGLVVLLGLAKLPGETGTISDLCQMR